MEWATLTREKVFYNRDNELFHFPEQEALMICPIGKVLPDTFIEANRKMLELGRKYQVRYLILNETQLLSIPTNARSWLMVNFLRSYEVREAMQALEKIVVVKSTNLMAATLMKVLHGIAGPLLGTTFIYFATEEEALTFLEGETIQ
ncbi:MAG TPA: hypothetical protein DCE41_28375 [Cytophagales bacterium]|nr:hypothetical protein [Cytophagales bacterium]HAA24006.1 hypothetical protein [Cytophagales bacterium]HAP58388.1 hypothetical protein [Cytophagales bacterium]